MTVRLVAAVILVGLAGALAGCSSADEIAPLEESTTAPATTARPETASWTLPPWESEDEGARSIRAFNAHLVRDATAGESPVVLAADYLGLARPNAARTSLVMTTPPELQKEAVVTATLEGLLDDSIRAIRYVLTFRLQDDETWRLRRARAEQRCAPGRGHQEFSAERCV